MNRTRNLVLHRTDCNPEHALPATEHVDHLVGAVRRIDGVAVRKQRHIGERLIRSELGPEDLDRGPDLLEAHAGVEQALDDLELDEIGEGVHALRTRPGSFLEGWAQQFGPGPVVELAVGDPHEFADLGGPVPDDFLIVRFRHGISSISRPARSTFSSFERIDPTRLHHRNSTSVGKLVHHSRSCQQPLWINGSPGGSPLCAMSFEPHEARHG